MSQQPTPEARKRWPAIAWVLLALPYIALCFPAIYARATPALFGFPFFYWYQFAWVIITSALLYVVYLLIKSR